jgi:sulfatase modifying factor 1
VRVAPLALLVIACGAAPPELAACPEGMIGVPGGGPLCLDRRPVDVGTFAASAGGRGLTVAEREGGVTFVVGEGFRVAPGASFRTPHGDGVAAPDGHPVTQLTALEAEAHCAARGARLPTAEEWERAARGGRGGGSAYPWGDELVDPRGAYRANVWQGAFPAANTLEDGFLFASPIGSFPPTPLGFLDLVGNVWQWTATPAGEEVASDPSLPRRSGRGRRICGGSFLCEAGRCHGYRIGARQQADEDTAFVHVGFRCAVTP